VRFSVNVPGLTLTGVFQNDLPGAPPPARCAGDFVERLHWFAEEIMPEARAIAPSSRRYKFDQLDGSLTACLRARASTVKWMCWWWDPVRAE
jgi:hypothetical protein